MSLNMHPKLVPCRTSKRALAEAQWSTCPLGAEVVDPKNFKYVPPMLPTVGEDGHAKFMQVFVGVQLDPQLAEGITHVANEEEGDGVVDLVVLKSETQHAI